MEVIAAEVERRTGRAEAHFDLGVPAVELAQPRQQPALQELVRDAQVEHAADAFAPDAVHRAAQLLESAAHARQQLGAFLGQRHGPRVATEQRHADVGFERLDLRADGGRRDPEFLRCGGEAQVRGTASNTRRAFSGRRSWSADIRCALSKMSVNNTFANTLVSRAPARCLSRESEERSHRWRSPLRVRILRPARRTCRAIIAMVRELAEFERLLHEVRIEAADLRAAPVRRAPVRRGRAGLGRGRARRVRPLVPQLLDFRRPARHLPRGPVRPARTGGARPRRSPDPVSGAGWRSSAAAGDSSGRCSTGTKTRSPSTAGSARSA